MPTNTVVGSARAVFTISLVAAATEEVRVDWTTKDGTALAGRDYETNGGTVSFAPGETIKTVEIFVHGRAVETEDRVFYVLLDPPVNALLADEIGACVIHVDTASTVPVMTVIVPRGEKGLTGDSAYQIALNNGFVGTEAEWLASLRPSPAEIATLVAPLINAGDMSVTAAGTEGMAHPDTGTVKSFAGRIALMPGAKRAVAAAMTAGVNIIPMSAFEGDSVDPTYTTGFSVVCWRGNALFGLDWEYLTSSNEIKIIAAQAGDVPIAVQHSVGSGNISDAPVKVGETTQQLRAWIGDLNDESAELMAFKTLLSTDAAGKGSFAIPHKGSTVGDTLSLMNQGVIYADDPRFNGDIEAAIAAVGDNTTLIVRQPYTTTKPLRIVGKTNPLVCCVGAGKLIGSRTAFTFPTANARGILHFDNCINPVAYKVDVLGARTAKSSFGADVLADGDAGIEYYQCSSPRTIECKIDQVLTWGVIHVGCTDTKTINNTISNTTRQSGIGHASVTGGLCLGNDVSYSGLYGIEVEGPGNSGIKVLNNVVHHCLVGIAGIGDLRSSEFKSNTVSLCTYLIQLNANGLQNNQVGVELTNNRTYDGKFHFFLRDTSFTDILGNTSLVRVASAYLPQRPADQVVAVISATIVRIMDASSGTILVGDIHMYAEGVARTVKTITTENDPVYGNCWLVEYTEPNDSIGFGSFFMRNTSLLGAGESSWFYMTGTRNSNINVDRNSLNGALGHGLDLNGNINALRWGGNRMVGVQVAFHAGDATGITNSAVVCKRGDIQYPGSSLFGGAAPQKIFPAMIGEMRTGNLLGPNKPIVFSTSGASHAFRLRVNIYGSNKTPSTGNVSITVNGVQVGAIPVADIGLELIQLDLALNVLANSYKINIADTYGDLVFYSASCELHTVEV